MTEPETRPSTVPKPPTPSCKSEEHSKPRPAVKRLPRPPCKDEPEDTPKVTVPKAGPQPKKMPRKSESKESATKEMKETKGPEVARCDKISIKSESSVSDTDVTSDDEGAPYGPSGVSLQLSPRTLAQEQKISQDPLPSWSNRNATESGRKGAQEPGKAPVRKDHLKSGRYDSYQSAYRQIKDSLECKLQAKMESGELSPKRNRGNRGGRANRRGRWTQWQRSRWRSSWDKGNGGDAEGTGGSAGSSLGPSRTSKEAQQLKQLTDLMELVAGQEANRWGNDWTQDVEVGDIRFNAETVSRFFDDGCSIDKLSFDRQCQREAGLDWCYKNDGWLLSNLKPLVVVHHKGADVVVKGRRRLKAALLLKQKLRGRLYIKCHCYNLDEKAAEVPATVLAVYALNPSANLDVIAV